ncbi:AraC family transcriptional regulator [Leucobacter iarius]|uniref:AraC family transcriptional regulator n=1 Tax=Leucobacter iarius TaxID=333963 RepID=A0ABN2LIT0_9MICO
MTAEFWRSDALPQLESRRSCREVACYRPHTHDRFSIGLIDAGESSFTGASGRAVELRSGDVLCIPAGHVHACNPEGGRWEYQMIHADQTWIRRLLGAAGPEAGETERLLGAISVFRVPGLHRRFDALNERLFAGGVPDPARIGDELRNGLRRCARAVPLHREAPVSDPETSTRLRAVIARLRDDETVPTLDELAELAGMSRFQLIRAMKRTTGLTPTSWRHDHRVNAARRLLREGGTLAGVAAELGFADQSHFHRVFRSHVASTPGSYRA